MAVLIRRSEAIRKLRQMEEKYAESGEKKAAEALVRVFNMLMSCKVEDRVFCAQCGKPVKTAKIQEDPGGS